MAVWALVQATPGLLTDWVHPAWGQANDALRAEVGQGAISVVPEKTRSAALLWFTYIGFGLLVALHARRETNADVLLTSFMLTQGAYAVYGILTYLAGLEVVLWFDKDAYRGVLTSTFINRNSYATYVGLGMLATLALLLRNIRQIIQTESEGRLKALTLADNLWGHLIIPVLVLSAGTVALLLTESRMGLVAFSLAAVVFLLIWVVKLPGRARWIGGVLIALVFFVVGANFVLSADATMGRFVHLFDQGDGRFDVFPLIVQAIEDRPWVGHGLGTFETAFRLYRDEHVLAFFDRGHSDWLELPMDLGVPAACAVALACLSLAGAALLSVRRMTGFERPLLAFAAILLVGVHATVDFSLQMPAVMVATLLLVGAGLAMSAQRNEVRTNDPETAGKRAHGAAIFVGH